MAKLDPPPTFEFHKPDEWPRWKRRFEQYRFASGLSTKDDTCQISTLLYCMGEDADDVLTTTAISNADRAKYTKVMEKLDEFYGVRTNVIYERARFNRRNQLSGETMDQYITALHRLAETCSYSAELKPEMIRDRLVVGILDTALSQKMQLDSKLDLDKAMKQCRQGEAVKEHQTILRGDGSKGNPIAVDDLRRSQRRAGAKKPHQQGRKPGGAKQGVNERLCKRCGGKEHPKGGNCPARDATCHKCNRKGHYSAQCFSKTVAKTTTDDQSVDTLFLDAVASERKSVWRSTIRLEGQEVQFKIDTGAEVTVITEDVYKSLGRQVPQLTKTSKRLQGPTGISLETLGEFKGLLEKAAKKCLLTIFVVRGLRSNLLGLPAITALQLVTRLDAVNSKWDPRTSYPKLFKGLGTMGEEYTIKVREDATPYALCTPRNVPIPMRAKVKQELDRMEEMGVISKVTDPSSWCAGMVVVPKASGAVRVCVDLKNLNQSVLREPHPIPSVDDTLAHLTGATVFSTRTWLQSGSFRNK